MYGLHDRGQVEDLCRRIYFPLQPLSIGDLTLFNGFLSILIEYLEYQKDHTVDAGDIKYFYNICSTNFRKGLHTYEVMAQPTYEHTLILSIAIINAQRDGKLALQWTLTSAAARHCLAQGFHREDRVKRLPSPERIRKLFWQIYTSDKNLALCLDRTPSIQDFDIDIQQSTISQDHRRLPWDQMSLAFVEFSRIQGQVYDMLYSVASRSLQPTERQSRVRNLSAKLSQWYEGWRKIDGSQAYLSGVFDCTFEPLGVIYFSVLTLVYRGFSSPDSTTDISPDCFETARLGLRAHTTYHDKISSKGMKAAGAYLNWVFYYSSFTPYIVTFIHCIRNSDVQDLELLKDILDTLEQISDTVQHPTKQLGLCKTLFHIAESFIEARKMESSQAEVSLNETLILPLQQSLSENWEDLDPAVMASTQLEGLQNNEWPGAWLNRLTFGLENRLG